MIVPREFLPADRTPLDLACSVVRSLGTASPRCVRVCTYCNYYHRRMISYAAQTAASACGGIIHWIDCRRACTGLARQYRIGPPYGQSWCTRCHQINLDELAPLAYPPSFMEIANMPSTTALAINVFLRTTHDVMPNYRLSRQEIDDVVAFILSLKDQKDAVTSRR